MVDEKLLETKRRVVATKMTRLKKAHNSGRKNLIMTLIFYDQCKIMIIAESLLKIGGKLKKLQPKDLIRLIKA